ncbi:MAG: glycosyltransferase family 4 protein [Vulcanimicrobiaceae bacterium]
MRHVTWGLIAGEYPPQFGGVGDYTWSVANELAARGDEVHVFAPVCDGPERPSAVRVHRLHGGFGPRGLVQLRRELFALPRPRRVILQFVVQSFGMRAMNVFLALWVRTLRHLPLWVMFHEYAIVDSATASPLHRVQAWVTRRIAASVARAAELAFFGTPEWQASLTRAAPRVPARWLPVPSNVAVDVDEAEVAERRRTFGFPSDAIVVGHFGTYRMRDSVQFLRDFIVRLLASEPDHAFVLIGRGSTEVARELERSHPLVAGRLVASGATSAETLATYIRACDLLVQPYPEGVTTRRGSVMAGLALGMPIVTTAGPQSEAVWTDAVALVPFDVAATVAKTIAVSRDAETRAALARRSREVYRTTFALDRLVDALRSSVEV